MENGNMTFVFRHKELERDELAIGSILSSSQYAELILGYLVNFKLNQAKYCYIRGREITKDELLRQIWEIGSNMCKKNFPSAAKNCRQLKVADPNLQMYITELQNRLIAVQLKLIAKCYSTIHLEKLAALIGYTNETFESAEVLALVNNCAWSYNANDGFIMPSQNAGFESYVRSLYNHEFGSAEEDGMFEKDAADNLKSLMNCTVFFDSTAITSNTNTTKP